MKNFIYQMAPWLDREEEKAIVTYLKKGGWLTEFKETEKFEKIIAEYLGIKYACALSNGTVSLFVALKALDINQGDEVIVPDLTMIATANAVILTGAKPVLVDIDPNNLCLDYELTKKAISPKTKAIILVSFNGRAPNINKFLSLAKKHNLYLIEDAAQSLGSKWQKKFLGTFGIIGSFSFSAPKIITTGQGGMLVTNHKKLIEKIKKIKDFGRKKSGVDKHVFLGYNFKFTDIQAVIGLTQFKKLPWRLERKKEIFALYQKNLKGIKEVNFIKTNLQQTSPWFIDILTSKKNKLALYLQKYKIGTRPFYPPIHTQVPYNQWPEYQKAHFPVSQQISKQGLWLPSSSFLSNKEVNFICQKIKDFFRE